MDEQISNIFKAYDIRGKVGTELTVDLARNIGAAMAKWLPVQGSVAVGRDMRPDSKQLADAMIEGLRTGGRDVWDIGEVTSDMIYFAIGKYDLAGGAVITASHNAGDYNGIKVYRDKVTPVGLSSGLDEIRDLALAGNFTPAESEGSLTEKNITDAWVDHAISMVQPESWPHYRIAIDAGNGMAGAILPRVLQRLPNLEAEEMYFALDGTFPNHEANPQKQETLRDLVKKIQDNGYDFGIAFDGDGDRAGFVDDKGRPILGTDLMAIVAKYVLEKHPGSEIVHDVRTSRATQELIREWGGTPIRTKAGRVNIGPLVRERQAPFGSETTGHMFFAENYDADSGLIVALVTMQSLSESGKKLSELVDEYRRYVMPEEMNFEVANKQAVFDKLKEIYAADDQDELDGLTVNQADGWFNLRASNTEPVMRLNVEATTEEGVQKLVDTVKQVIAEVGE
jgi:phosphomannomutase